MSAWPVLKRCSAIPVEMEHAVAAIRQPRLRICSVYVGDVLYVSRAAGSLGCTTVRRSRDIRCFDLGAAVRIGKPPTKVLFICEDHKTPSIQALLEQVMSGSAHVTRSSPNYVELMNKKVSKASALEHLCRLLGVLPEETMAIGDGYNDMEMLRFAGTGVAMANSPDPVKSIATSSSSSDEDGVAAALEMLV